MHTHRVGKIDFIYNGGYDGNVHVNAPLADSPAVDSQGRVQVVIPMDTILNFVAKAVRQQRLTALEQMSDRELLGLPL